MKRIALPALLLASLLPALAQDNVDVQEERSMFLSWVENRISTPDRRISISRIEGVLSSNARIGRITIADREGVWLAIENAEIEWTRTALLRGRLQVGRLAAERIEMSRRPLPPEGSVPSPEASGFAVPDLPVSVALDELDIERIVFGEEAFGLASELNLTGSLSIESTSFSAELSGQRLDGPGGTLNLAAALDEEADRLDVDFSLEEPENGVVANLLNVYGRPSIALSLAGSGPVDNMELALTLDADAERVLEGTARIAGNGDKRMSIAVEGPIGRLVAPQLRDLFGDNSRLALEAASREQGGYVLSRLAIDSGALVLDGSAETAADGFPTRISLDGRVRAADGQRVVLPLPGGDTSLRNATLRLQFGGTDAGSWSGAMRIEDFSTAGFAAEVFNLDLKGAANRLADPATRQITFNLDGVADGLSAADPALQQAIGERAGLLVRSAWQAGQPVVVQGARLDTRPLQAEMAGNVRDWTLDGRFRLETANASVLAEALDRPLAGSASLTGAGTIGLLDGSFNLALDGKLEDFISGTPSLDRMISGEARLTGRAIRDERGIGAENLRFVSDGLRAQANGIFGTENADLRIDATIADLARVSDRMEGPLQARVTARGTEGRIGLDAQFAVDRGALSGRPLTQARLGFAGQLERHVISGKLTGNGLLDQESVSLDADLSLGPDEKRLDNLAFRAGLSELTGNVATGRSGLYRAALDLDSPDISLIAALLLAEASGEARASIRLAPDEDRQFAEIDASLSRIVAEDMRIGSAELQARITDLFGVPGVDGSLSASDVRLAGANMAAVTARASQQGERTGFEAGARFTNGTSLATAGVLTRLEEGFRLSLGNLDLVRDRVLAQLARPAEVELNNGTWRIRDLALSVDGGSVSAQGTAGERLDLALQLVRLPLAPVNSMLPDLALSGVLDGTVAISGTRESPDVRIDAEGRDISARALADAGIPPLAIRATGRTEGQRLQLDAGVTSATGIDARLAGELPLGQGNMNLDLALRAFPLEALDRLAPGLGGRLSGSARITGSLDQPQTTFDLQGASVRAAQLTDAGIEAIDLAAAGSLAGRTVRLTSLRATGPQGLTANASGAIPLEGPGLDLAVDARAPLALANRFLSGGASASGSVTYQGRIGGSLQAPVLTGSIASDDAAYSDPSLRIALRNISVRAGIERNRLTIQAARAGIAAGGSASLGGNLLIDADAGFPADLSIRLEEARYLDGSLVAATVSGNLDISGALARDPLVTGSITVNRAEIVVPEQLGQSLAAIDVEHVDPPAAVRRTLALARADDGTPVPTGRPSVARLDVTVRAANQIFLRGRGLDAELGGSVRLTGPVTAIEPVGGFQLIRGRLAILGKRIVFDRGEVTLVGDLDPFVDFLATSDAGDVMVMIAVTGRVSDPAIVFSSQPELPQDEVLARLIFGRGISELSVLQMARLAAAAASLVGGGNDSLLGGFRQATGLDELDVITDSSGNAAVRAGRYIRDNIYLGVEAGAGGQTRATINIDITGDLKAKGSTGSDGDSSIGLFYEKDY